MSAADRREGILDAALEEFAMNGYHETSLEGVATRAGISKALIYEHFSSKRELHEALLSRYDREVLDRVIAAIASPNPVEQRLYATADAFLSFVEENREPWRLIVRNPGVTGVDESVGQNQKDMAQAIASVLQADAPQELAVDSPDQGRFEVEMIAQQMLGAWRGVAIWWDDHRDVPREQLVRMIMNVGWMGLDRLSQGELWEG
jgi:AcrR family transcriptional regulator